jgi:hypothetical protein
VIVEAKVLTMSSHFARFQKILIRPALVLAKTDFCQVTGQPDAGRAVLSRAYPLKEPRPGMILKERQLRAILIACFPKLCMKCPETIRKIP